jgi:carbon storage regulator
MLVMSRRQGETILIGDEIEIVIAHVGRSRVKVGIRAPRQMQVIAREVKLVSDENQRAASASAPGLSHLIERLHPRVARPQESGIPSEMPEFQPKVLDRS